LAYGKERAMLARKCYLLDIVIELSYERKFYWNECFSDIIPKLVHRKGEILVNICNIWF